MTDDHYFADRPKVASKRQQVTLTLPDLRFELTTDRGVFSAKGVDPGSKYLLLEAPTPPATTTSALDIGCGYGPIALTMANRLPDAAVWAVDVNDRALDLCRHNATELGLEGVRVARPEEVPADVRFDLIWSNPPIRIGKPALHELLETWLNRLHPTGRAVLVVQKHLGSDSLQKWLTATGWPTERLSSRAGYRLLDVRARDQGSGP